MTWAMQALAFVLVAQGGAQPPFAGDPDQKVEQTRPAIRTWTVNANGFSYNIEFSPGIPNAGQLVEMTVAVSRIPKTPHPRFGNRIPQADARFVLEMRDPDGKVVGRYRAHALPLTRGRYGLHFTPAKDGLHTITIAGQSNEGLAMKAETKLPVNVWPLPKELQGTGDDAGKIRRRRPIVLPKN